jgi:hypothetical protein
VVNLIKNLDWFDGDPTSLALIALAIVAFSLITAFAAAAGLRQARKPALAAAGDRMPATSVSEALDEGEDEAAHRESKSRLQPAVFLQLRQGPQEGRLHHPQQPRPRPGHGGGAAG